MVGAENLLVVALSLPLRSGGAGPKLAGSEGGIEGGRH